MQSESFGKQVPEVTVYQRRLNDFRHRVLKLRWIGCDDDAEILIEDRRRQDGTTPVCQFELDTD